MGVVGAGLGGAGGATVVGASSTFGSWYQCCWSQKPAKKTFFAGHVASNFWNPRDHAGAFKHLSMLPCIMPRLALMHRPIAVESLS